MPDQANGGRRSLFAVVVAGLLGGGCGLAIAVGSADHLLRLGDGESVSSEVVASVVGRALLVVTEAMACLLFAGLAGLVFAVRNRDVARLGLVLGALLKTFWLIASVTVNWELGWYHVFDPQRGHAIWLAVFSVLQALLWFVAAARR